MTFDEFKNSPNVKRNVDKRGSIAKVRLTLYGNGNKRHYFGRVFFFVNQGFVGFTCVAITSFKSSSALRNVSIRLNGEY